MKKKYGFNMRWMFSYNKTGLQEVNEKQLDFIAKHGFNFIRVPLDYRFWTTDFDYLHPDEKVLGIIDTYIEACRKRGLHMCLNIHRAPGYCVNDNNLEKHNLWVDEPAQEAFVFLWEYFASKYKGIPSSELSFDLLNEPPAVGDFQFTRDIHEKLMRRVIKAIRTIDPSREIVLDGISCGNLAIPELADAGVIHSGRGYHPFLLSHYKAPWVEVDWNEYPQPCYPKHTQDESWDKEALRKYYAPWVAVEKKGVEVHIGEFGCYKYTPNDVALRWFGDLMSVFKENGWGYSMWHFEGPFGIVNHGRPGTVYTEIDGFNVDKQLLDLMLDHMTK